MISCVQARRLAKQSSAVEKEQDQNTTLEKWKISLNPLATLNILLEKESGIILLYNGFFFTGIMVTTSSIPTLFKEAYNLSELDIGLCYIASGIGSLLSSLTMGHVVD